jgi:hypothetical protein
MTSKTKFIVTGAVAAAAIALTGATAAQATSNDDDEREAPITGTDLTRATEAALSYLGEGRVTGTEVGDEESRYEVEVMLPDGRQVDVQLDERFQVVGAEGDSGAEEDS